MRKQEIYLITSVILSMISIAGILYWYDWKLLLCIFFFEWGRNSYRKHEKQKEEAEDDAFGERIKQIFDK